MLLHGSYGFPALPRIHVGLKKCLYHSLGIYDIYTIQIHEAFAVAALPELAADLNWVVFRNFGVYMGGYQNHGPLLRPLDIRCRIIVVPKKEKGPWF